MATFVASLKYSSIRLMRELLLFTCARSTSEITCMNHRISLNAFLFVCLQFPCQWILVIKCSPIIVLLLLRSILHFHFTISSVFFLRSKQFCINYGNYAALHSRFWNIENIMHPIYVCKGSRRLLLFTVYLLVSFEIDVALLPSSTSPDSFQCYAVSQISSIDSIRMFGRLFSLIKCLLE